MKRNERKHKYNNSYQIYQKMSPEVEEAFRKIGQHFINMVKYKIGRDLFLNKRPIPMHYTIMGDPILESDKK